MTLTPGLHAIINKKSGTALTASDGPLPRAVTGSQYDEAQNQQWLLIDLGRDIWEIRTLSSGGFMGMLGGPLPESEIFVVSGATQWRITHADGYGPNHYEITPAYSDLRAVLANDGSADPGTPVDLQPFFLDLESQVWEFRYLSG